jgi:hypothetical protein
MKALIDSWAIALGVEDWDIRTERIEPKQIEYNGEDYFVGIERDFDGRKAVIYHDIPLDEESIVHELLHIAFPQAEDEDYDDYEDFIARTTKDTIFLHYIN